MKHVSAASFQSWAGWVANLAVLGCILLAPQMGYAGMYAGQAGSAMDDTAVAAISGDGNTIVGTGIIDGYEHAFRWTEKGGMQYLGVPGKESVSTAAAVSNDGSVVVGYEERYPAGGGSNDYAFLWTEKGGMKYLDVLKGMLESKGSSASRKESPWREGRIDRATAVSSDGNVVVGWSGTNENMHAFRWTEKGGMETLGMLTGGKTAAAGAVSSDGSVVVGAADTGNWTHAFRWTKADGMKDLGALGSSVPHTVDGEVVTDGNISAAAAASDDGNIVAGASSVEGGDSHVFHWTKASGMKDIGTLGGTRCEMAALSGDGRVVVGNSLTKDDKSHAFRWSETSGMKDLGTLGGKKSEADAVSKDGKVVAGESDVKSGFSHAFRWTEADGMKDLGTLGGESSVIAAISDDGSVFVGESRIKNGAVHLFRWTQRTGMADLGTLASQAKSSVK